MRKIIILLTLLPALCFASANTVVYNVTSKQVIRGELNSTEVSIASLSKLMTVYTVLSQGQDLDEKLSVKSKKLTNSKVSKGMVATRRDLLDLALISSDNTAAVTLSENFPGGTNYFVYMMNKHADDLGLTHTGFVEPTGLSPMNYSSITDIVALTQIVSQFDIVQRAAQASGTTAQVSRGKKNSKVKGNPTSSYFGKQGVITIKTGFTRAAGFCVTMLVQSNNQLYNITVLGAKTKQERQKIVEKSLKSINA